MLLLLRFCLLSLFLTLAYGPATAQPGLIDPSFNPADSTAYLRFPAKAMLRLPDGRVLIGDGGNLQRYDTAGRFDSSFRSGSGFNWSIDIMALQPDGKILVAGQFSAYNGEPCRHLARLLPSGDPDPSFDVWPGIDTIVIEALARQSDGRILTGGNGRLLRLRADGSLEPGFDATIGRSSIGFPRIYALKEQPDGKILVGGIFNTFNNAPHNHLLRLNPDGSADPGFNTGTGFSPDSGGIVQCLEVLPDGRILVGGLFNSYNNLPLSNLAWLNSDGSPDGGFTSTATAPVTALALQPGGGIIAGGYSVKGIARILLDGTEDPSYATGNGFHLWTPGFPSEAVLSMVAQPDGRLLVGGEFRFFNQTGRVNVLRLLADGSLDSGFVVGGAFDQSVDVIAVQPDSMILAGGSFQSYYGMPRRFLARLYPDGRIDTSFNPTLSNAVTAIAIQPDGRILVGGIFEFCSGRYLPCLARLNKDGTLDTAFNTGFGFGGDGSLLPDVRTIAIQSDGKILAGGAFITVNRQSRRRLARLFSDGRLDTAFNVGRGMEDGAGNYCFVDHCNVFPGGKLLAGGRFTSYNGQAANGIIRINDDGSRDETFNVPADAGSVREWVLQDDSLIIAAAWNGAVPQSQIVRLLPDGSLDAGFNPFAANNSYPLPRAVQADGKILIVNNQREIFRLHKNGAPDESYAHGTAGLDYTYLGQYYLRIGAVTLQPDGRILAGGNFYTYRQQVRNNIVRLQNCVIPARGGSLPPAYRSAPYYGTVYDSRYAAGLRFTIDSGSLPPGLILDPGGAVTGLPSSFGTYSFIVRADNGSCSDTSHRSLYVDLLPHELLVWPNPTSGIVHIRPGDSFVPGTYRIDVTDLLGRTVAAAQAEIRSKGGIIDIDLRHLAGATYMVSIAYPQGRIVYKLLKL